MKAISIITLALALLLVFGCTDVPTPYTNDSGVSITDNNIVADDNSSGTEVNNLGDFEKVKTGDNVSVHYTGKLEDGEVFDSSVGRDPLTFEAGAGQMIKGFDAAVMEMKVGDKKTITLAPEEAYGASDPARIQEIPKTDFSGFPELTVGLVVSATNGMQGTILEIDDNTVKVDFNHKLAGKTLIFDIELVSINK